ncbi:MAG: hypothetical protein AMXMBFR13_40910 [Phycisphaerae bacterium]
MQHVEHVRIPWRPPVGYAHEQNQADDAHETQVATAQGVSQRIQDAPMKMDGFMIWVLSHGAFVCPDGAL